MLVAGSSNDLLWSLAGLLVKYSSLLGFYTSSMCIFAHVWSLQDTISDRTTRWMSRSSQELVLDRNRGRWTTLWDEIIQELREVAKFSGLVNVGISTQLAMYIADEAFYFPVAISKTLRPDGVTFAFLTIVELIRFWLTLLMCAEVKAKVTECINDIANETYLVEGWAFANVPTHAVSITMDRIVIKFSRRYDVDYAFLGAVSNIVF